MATQYFLFPVIRVTPDNNNNTLPYQSLTLLVLLTLLNVDKSLRTLLNNVYAHWWN